MHFAAASAVIACGSSPPSTRVRVRGYERYTHAEETDMNEDRQDNENGNGHELTNELTCPQTRWEEPICRRQDGQTEH